jgi:hypothetical protein
VLTGSQTKVMSEIKSDKSEEPSKKLNDEFSFQQLKDAKSECNGISCCLISNKYLTFNGSASGE